MQLKKEDQKSFNMSQWVCIDLLIVAVRMIGNYHNNSHATAGTDCHVWDSYFVTFSLQGLQLLSRA